MQIKPNVKTIRSLDERPKEPEGLKYEFKPAVTLDAARGVVQRQQKTEGWWLRNRVYFLVPAAKA